MRKERLGPKPQITNKAKNILPYPLPGSIIDIRDQGPDLKKKKTLKRVWRALWSTYEYSETIRSF